MIGRWSGLVAGLLFLGIGLLGVFTGDALLGGMWALLGLSMLLSNPFRKQALTYRHPRMIAATAALLGALALLLISFV